MAVDLSLESAEKYFWTWLDIMRFGPRQFRERLMDDPTRYLTPVKFFLGTLFSFGTIILIGAETLKGSETVSISAWRTYIGADAKTFVGRHILYVAVLVFYGTLANRFTLWWPLKSPSSMSNVLTAKLYASAALVPFAAFDSLAVCGIVFVSPYFAAHYIRLLVVGSLLIEFLILGTIQLVYDLWSISVFCQVKICRMLEGQIILIITGTIWGGGIGFAIGGAIGGISGAWKATPIHTLPYMSVLIITCVLVVCLSLAVGSVTIWVYTFLLRQRLAKLQQAVQVEYAAYRPNRALL